MEFSDLVISLVVGIVSSTVAVILMEVIRKSRDRILFSNIAGTYAHYNVQGDRELDGFTEITYRGGNVLETTGTSSEGTWRGRIVMNRDIPQAGAGIYEYPSRTDCGLHQIQTSLDGASIFVLAVNTSHGRSNTCAYLWRRVTNTAA